MGNQFTPGRVQVGFGIETTSGTEVAPTDWIKQTKLDLNRQIEVAEHEGSVGRIEDVLDSDIVAQWSQGTLEGLVGHTTFVYPLYALLGTKAVADNPDTDASIKDHTLDVAQTNTPPTLTLVRKDTLTNRRHGNGTVESIDIEFPNRGYVTFAASVKAEAGVTGSDSATYPTDYYFTSKHVVVKLASAVGGLGAASAVALKSGKLSIKKSSADPFVPLGGVDPTVFNTGRLQITGELTLLYDATTYEDLWIANTVRAMSITLQNTDITIGTSARPTIAFTMPKVRFREFSRTDDADQVVEQVLAFKAELDLTTGYPIRVVVTNAKASY